MKKIMILIFVITYLSNASVAILDSVFMELDPAQMHTKYLWDKQKRHIDPMFLSGNVNNDTLEKIEELTLYVIQLKKENDEIKKKLNEVTK